MSLYLAWKGLCRPLISWLTWPLRWASHPCDGKIRQTFRRRAKGTIHRFNLSVACRPAPVKRGASDPCDGNTSGIQANAREKGTVHRFSTSVACCIVLSKKDGQVIHAMAIRQMFRRMPQQRARCTTLVSQSHVVHRSSISSHMSCTGSMSQSHALPHPCCSEVHEPHRCDSRDRATTASTKAAPLQTKLQRCQQPPPQELSYLYKHFLIRLAKSYDTSNSYMYCN